MINKKWWTSKTVWTNIIAIIGIIFQTNAGTELIPAELQVTILSIINILLRTISKSNITW